MCGYVDLWIGDMSRKMLGAYRVFYYIVSGNIGKFHSIVQKNARLYFAFIQILENRINHIFPLVVNVDLCG